MKDNQGVTPSGSGLPPASRAEPVVSGKAGIPNAERALVARARGAFTRFAGMEFGDKLADELWESRKARYD